MKENAIRMNAKCTNYIQVPTAKEKVFYTKLRINDGLYVGETARSIGERVSEHLAKYEVKYKNPIFQKHIEEKHGGERQDVQCN